MAGVFSGSIVYQATLVVLVVGTAIGTVFAARRPSSDRRAVALGLLAPAGMTVAYLGMLAGWLTVQTTATDQSLFRFFGYTVTALVLAELFRRLVRLSTKQTAILAGTFLLYPWASLGTWVLGGAGEQVATVIVLGSLLFGAYLLYGPLAGAAVEVGGRRYLMYRRLRNHIYLLMSILVVISLLSDQALEVLTHFTAQLAAGYADIIYAFGIATLVYLSLDLLTAGDSRAEEVGRNVNSSSPQSQQQTSDR